MKPNIYFISGIDTDAGKSYCTAWYAKQLSRNGQRVITQKFIQTGNTGHSEDIDLHRRIMGTGYLPEDNEGLTMPEIFSYPCSPHLAAVQRRLHYLCRDSDVHRENDARNAEDEL